MFNNNLLMGAASAGGVPVVSIGKSALFDDANSEYLSRTPSGAGNLRKWTLSLWAYRCDLGTGEFKIWSAINGSSFDMVAFSGNELGIEINTSTSSTNSLRSNALFRDQGWYHIVVVWDSDNTVATNRIRAWVNGERITSWRAGNFPGSAGVNSLTNSTVLHTLGAKANVSQYFDGYLAESVLIDGLALEPTSFGEYDSTGTFWTPLSSATIKGLTFGTNGFYLDNTTNAQTDASGEGNNFTNNNTVTTSTHTPTNINTLMNPLSMFQSMSLANGNNKVTFTAATYTGNIFTIPIPPTGKWKMEVDMTAITGGLIRMGIIEKTEYSPKNMSSSLPFDNDSLGNPDFNTISTSGGNASAIGKVDGTAYSYASEANGSRVVSNGDRWALYYDADSGKFWAANDDGSGDTTYFYEDSGGTAGNPATGSNPLATSNTSKSYQFYVTGYSDPTANRNFLFKEEADWILTTPTGYAPLTTTKIASAITRTHSNLEEYFDSTLYEGNGAGQRVGKFLPFTNAFTVGNSGLFKLVSTSQNTSNPRLTRTQDAGASNKKFSFSFWYKRGQLGSSRQTIWNNDPTATASIRFDAAGTIAFEQGYAVGAASSVTTTRVFTDTSQWNNVIIVIDTTQATASDRQTIYVNGVSQTLTIATQLDQNADTSVGGADSIAIGSFIASSSPSLPFDGYLAEFVYVNNQVLSPSDVGQVDTSTGRWIPKTLGGLSFGSTDYYLNFATLGDDVSGNDNDFTNANVVQVADTPTVNANVWNSSESGFSGGTFTNGNRTVQTGTSQYAPAQAGLPISSGKWYTEVVPTATSNAASFQIGITKGLTTANTQQLGSLANDVGYSGQAGNLFYNGESGSGGQSYGASYAVNDVIGMAIDFDANTITFYKNGASQGVITLPSTTTASTPYFIACNHYDNSSNGTFLLRSLSSDWTGSAPTGHLAIIQDNMPTGESYQTAFSWIKNRDATDNHMLFDRVRGIYNDIHSNVAAAQVTNVNTLQRFLNGGVQVGNDVQVNTVNESYVAWNWYMETAGTGTSNTDGGINTEATLVDTNLGLSISKFDSGANGDHTIGHGLGVVPEFVIFKDLESANNVAVYHSGAGFSDVQDYLLLNSTAGVADNGASIWGAAFPTSSVLGFTTGQICNANKDCVAYCFTPSQFTAIGSYKSNADANGPFVPTVNSLGIPIQPAWVMVKDASGASQWWVWDNQRSPFNLSTKVLYPNLSNAEDTSVNISIDMVEGGFKLRTSSNPNGSSGNTYIYLAFGTPIIDVDGRIITGR